MGSMRRERERRLAVSASEPQQAGIFDVGVTSRCRSLPFGPFALRMFVSAYRLNSRSAYRQPTWISQAGALANRFLSLDSTIVPNFFGA